MNNLKRQIEQDLKTAMLAGNKTLATTLRGLKSAILYEEVAKGKREAGLAEAEITSVLSKEAKKRQESADLYAQGGNLARAEAEILEKEVIEKYLPAAISDEQLSELLTQAESELGPITSQNMGQVIGWVKAKSVGSVDGARIAAAVKERLA